MLSRLTQAAHQALCLLFQAKESYRTVHGPRIRRTNFLMLMHSQAKDGKKWASYLL